MAKMDLPKPMSPEMRRAFEALRRAAQLARDVAIETNTGIVIVRDGQLVRISAAELRAERGE